MATVYTKNNTALRRKIVKFFGVVALLSGLFLLTYFFFPLISYQLFLKKALASGRMESPLPRHLLVKENGITSLLINGVESLTTDYTDARNWFPKIEGKVGETKIDSYLLSIPKIKIDKAKVSTNSYDLTKSLVQYYGDSAPPEIGTAVIYGHSTLPQFFSNANYETIFATVHNLEIGDEMFVHIPGKNYRYKIFSIEITDPEDVNIFSQSYDNSYITLVTCTPPGTIWKRLIVRASLIDEV